ncbi:Inosine/uridine-preferring nucleoside hydrolase domain-containing protein [Flagelloscypha sp. PMI_526]|nr:Inosine/uridine-preferring nucleoside hydrolase domain-containing protein [Flagelloscypha sp. PMI_526]
MNRIPVIIDTDPGVDDVVALLLALASPELDVLAILISYGNTDLDASYANILKLFNAVGASARFSEFTHSIPIIAKGSTGPVAGELHSAVYFHGRDGLGEITTRYPSHFLTIHNPAQVRVTEEPAVDIAYSLIKEYPARSITWIALGPLTNLYHVVNRDSDLFRDKIGKVVIMGGALDVPGNTTPSSEFNFYADPYSVRELLTSSNPTLPLERVLLLPLDITTPHELPFPLYEEYIDQTIATTTSIDTSKDPLVQFTSAFLQATRKIMKMFGKDAMELHDIVAEGLAAGWQTQRRIFDIERIGELTRGMLVVDRREDESLFETGANREEAFAEKDFSHVPAPVEVELPPVIGEVHGQGVHTVVKTPGHKVLLKLLLKEYGHII